MSRTTVGKWENGEAIPRGDEVYELLGIPRPGANGDRRDGRSTGDGPDIPAVDPSAPSAMTPAHLASLSTGALVRRGQALAAEQGMILALLAERVDYEPRPVTAPSRSAHPRMQTGPLDPEDRPLVEDG